MLTKDEAKKMMTVLNGMSQGWQWSPDDMKDTIDSFTEKSRSEQLLAEVEVLKAYPMVAEDFNPRSLRPTFQELVLRDSVISLVKDFADKEAADADAAGR